jgi:hypothetical protein
MRRLLTWFGLSAGALLVFRRFRRRKPQPAEADPAEELKQKLAESRADQPAAPAAPEPEAEHAPEPEQPAAPIDQRRRAVHDKARAAIDDMLGGEKLPGEETE